ncbi:plasmid maintenance protein CcdB [Paramagnetospirillum kuznetsovii]|uniref:Toxin CcdB n=1 Tax=Paramagnetospirillum kuznetsovii TaxID=2053833 RepID=A0A364NXR1_9PROT|nr:CcdB family protein [Paramagnetospirillum kuznetsovii]RAU21871.1 plasmid maintenance protein CcdB [Paramagnetospirillum kuznetsovii]
MARELYRLAGVNGYVMNVQADLLASFATTVVVPILPAEEISQPMARLNPTFEIDGRPYVMVTQAIAAVARRDLGEAVGLVGEDRHSDLTQALDLLFSGF